VNEANKWIYEFEKRAGPWLREIFKQDLGTIPPELIERIEMLRKAENKLLNGKPRKIAPECCPSSAKSSRRRMTR
jgi:predicted transcriptional regulator